MRSAILGAWVIAVVWPIEGQAQSYRQLSQWCYGQSSDTETVVGCNAVIRWSRESLRDSAIEDYDLALRLRPDFADAWNERGVAYRQKGDTAGGDADIAAARARRPALSDVVARSGVN